MYGNLQLGFKLCTRGVPWDAERIEAGVRRWQVGRIFMLVDFNFESWFERAKAAGSQSARAARKR